jgi:hypothetical protein
MGFSLLDRSAVHSLSNMPLTSLLVASNVRNFTNNGREHQREKKTPKFALALCGGAPKQH